MESSSTAGGGVSQHNAPFSPSRQVELPEEFKAQSAGEQASKQAAQSVVQASETLDGTPKKPTNWLGGVFLALGAGLTLIIVGKVLLGKFRPTTCNRSCNARDARRKDPASFHVELKHGGN